MTTVITPGPGQAVIKTDGEGHHGHHGNHEEWSQAVLREQAAGFRIAATDSRELAVAIKDARHDVVQDVKVAATAAALAACKTDDGVADKFCALSKQVSDTATATVVGFKDAQATAYQIEGRSLLEAAKNANALAVQADKNTAQLNLQAVTFAAAAQLEAVKNAAAIAAQVAACCCELKEKIDGAETARLRDELTQARAAQAAFFAAKVAPVTPTV